MDITWMDVVRSVVMLGIFFRTFYVFMRFALQSYEHLTLPAGPNRGPLPKAGRIAQVPIALSTLSAALAITAIWTGWAPVLQAILVGFFVVIQIACSFVARRAN